MRKFALLLAVAGVCISFLAGVSPAQAQNWQSWVSLESFNRHRGKGQQKVTVELVHVHAGGEAVVGMVQTPGDGPQAQTEDQGHPKQITHAPSANGAGLPIPNQ